MGYISSQPQCHNALDQYIIIYNPTNFCETFCLKCVYVLNCYPLTLHLVGCYQIHLHSDIFKSGLKR